MGNRFALCVCTYVDPEVHPQNEDYWGHVNPIGPRACYDEGKRVAETMCYAYMKQVCLIMMLIIYSSIMNFCSILWLGGTVGEKQ